jgi:hypothetical protein
MDASTIIVVIWVIATSAITIYDIRKVAKASDSDIQFNKRLFESYATNLSIGGVLGTFIGITYGLLSFDSDNLDTSVPQLLDGLKFAFITSIAGMSASWLVNKCVNQRYDSLGVSDMTTAALNLSKSVAELKASIENNNTKVLETTMQQIANTFKEEMGKVSAELSGLMKKLIDKNFEELNSSISNLNAWQQENKTVMDKMSQTSTQIISDLDTASYRISEVSKYIGQLTAPCGYLGQLVSDLHSAMSDDSNFVEISNNLSSACRDINESVTDWGGVIKSLDDWLKTQQNYKNNIENLIIKLDELNKQRDYNDDFWQTTRQGMNDAAGIIGKANEKLKKDLAYLDEQFYERLNATLSNLDDCIKAFIRK